MYVVAASRGRWALGAAAQSRGQARAPRLCPWGGGQALLESTRRAPPAHPPAPPARLTHRAQLQEKSDPTPEPEGSGHFQSFVYWGRAAA